MDLAAWLDVIRSNAVRLADAARTAGMEAGVPTCEGWTVADLVTHQGGVYRWAAGVLESGSQTDPGPFPSRPVGSTCWTGTPRASVGSSTRWRRSTLTGRCGTGAAGAPAPARFWLRRMAHETIIHRVDAETAAGQRGAVEPPELAADGIDEYLEFLRTSSWTFDPRLGDLRGGLALQPTDVRRAWQVDFTADGIGVHQQAVSSGACLRGTASDLLPFAYNRRPADDIEMEGDLTLVKQWRDAVRFL
jgi:uncharacterized protein (TIGR03083 family)